MNLKSLKIYKKQYFFYKNISTKIFLQKKYGGVLLSHTVASEVPSALKGLTSVFGMGTGVAPSL